MLPFSELRYQLIASKIRELNNGQHPKFSKGHTADIALTNFEFGTHQTSTRKMGLTEFFIMAVSHNTDIYVTKSTTSEEGKLVFPDKFCFKNVDDNFSVKIEVFSMKLKTEKSLVDTLLRKVCTSFFTLLIMIHLSQSTAENSLYDLFKWPPR